jgi:hypothetical protein
MAYRNGTYIAFHADGTNVPTDSDIKYYNLMKAWTEKEDDDFHMINSHEKTSAVRDSSKKETLRTRLKERLKNSKHMVLIISPTTKNDTDWVPFEIEYAIDECDIPIIVAYTDFESILAPNLLSNLWPASLKKRIDNGTASCIHIPFKKTPLKDAISQFSHKNKPNGGGLGYYSREAYTSFGIDIK